MEFLAWFLLLLAVLANVKTAVAESAVRLYVQDKYVVVDNGIFSLTLSRPGGGITAIQYKGVDNLLANEGENMRGYWDLVWSGLNSSGHFDVIQGTSFTVIKETEDQVELSFKRTWDSSLTDIQVPLIIDKRFVVLRGSSGFYSYAIYDHLQGWPGFYLSETRIALKLRSDKFRFMALDDSRFQRMPRPEDRNKPRAQPLAFLEAVLLVDPTDPELKGATRVDDKYQFSDMNKDNRVHGWITEDSRIGIWQITPSDEFKVGGPMKQELTSHVGPTMLSVFHSAHYAGGSLVPRIENGEPWKKVYGPVFFYLNSDDYGHGRQTLWEDAKRQMTAEVQSWPYNFPASEDFLHSYQRGSVHGRLLVKDWYVTGDHPAPAAAAYVGMAPPGTEGSWQTECKSYQFWTTTYSDGYFTIKNVRPGEYNLYAWVPGFIGDYKTDWTITITAGGDINLGDLEYKPIREGPTLWEIGVPDRTALEFYIPDPNPIYYNNFLWNPNDRFRQYGLWEKYGELYPNGYPVYDVAWSDYHKDWFFAHICQYLGNSNYLSPTRRIKFNVSNIAWGTYKLRVAIAGALKAALKVLIKIKSNGVYFPGPVKINLNDGSRPIFRKWIGEENIIPRHGIHGLYRLVTIDVRSEWLVQGENTFYFTLDSCRSPFQGIVYDYIRLEAPPS
ncbi:hypothetical protein H6P81_020279 [Aristolochia fimbriata]|uniref:rhamnogalacturonan endolyase n=1 Tax=Aristolochia fimbriata TaxID=158543 RepID=A0AAV7DV50_ARIFI|nr:hypothetical protein H6P81_020279 [Aristolochia fimbriata]